MNINILRADQSLVTSSFIHVLSRHLKMTSQLPLHKAIISLALPPISLIISFSLALASALSSHWAISSVFSPIPNTQVLWPNRTHPRGVFCECVITAANGTNDPLAPPTETCSRYGPGGGTYRGQYNSTLERCRLLQRILLSIYASKSSCLGNFDCGDYVGWDIFYFGRGC